jgi:hypothetical protein
MTILRYMQVSANHLLVTAKRSTSRVRKLQLPRDMARKSHKAVHSPSCHATQDSYIPVINISVAIKICVSSILDLKNM